MFLILREESPVLLDYLVLIFGRWKFSHGGDVTVTVEVERWRESFGVLGKIGSLTSDVQDVKIVMVI